MSDENISVIVEDPIVVTVIEQNAISISVAEEESEPVVVVLDEPTVIEAIEQETITIAATSDEPVVITIGEAGEALQAHAILTGVGAHIPPTGIAQSLVIGLAASLGAIDQRLDLIESNPGAVTGYQFSLNASDRFYHYFGGVNVSGEWKINRFDRSNGLQQSSADRVLNAAYLRLGDAWSGRSDLVYEEV